MKREDKKKIMKKYGVHDKDTGSAHVQIAIITERINELSKHLETHPKDDHSRKGLLKLVGKRRNQLNFLKLNKPEDYEKLIKVLKLRK